MCDKMSGENWKRPTTISIGVGTLEKIDRARGGTPRSRWIEERLLTALNCRTEANE